MKMITEFNLFHLLNLRKNLNLEDLFQYYKYIYIYINKNIFNKYKYYNIKKFSELISLFFI